MKNSIEYLDKIIKILEPPYFYEMGLYGIDESYEMEYVMSKVFGIDIRIGYCGSTIYKNQSQLYYESIFGNWKRKEYDSNGNNIYSEYSTGEWYKSEYDLNGNRTYYENSNGLILDNI
jgi:hypothetical protein